MRTSWHCLHAPMLPMQPNDPEAWEWNWSSGLVFSPLFRLMRVQARESPDPAKSKKGNGSIRLLMLVSACVWIKGKKQCMHLLQIFGSIKSRTSHQEMPIKRVSKTCFRGLRDKIGAGTDSRCLTRTVGSISTHYSNFYLPSNFYAQWCVATQTEPLCWEEVVELWYQGHNVLWRI